MCISWIIQCLIIIDTWCKHEEGIHGSVPLLQYTDVAEEERRSPIGQRTPYATVIQQPPAQIFEKLFYLRGGKR